ncbi:MAG: DUF357 domain-containing protein [Candidatus Thermoplasmatota archaeon]|nr:DUF357 domain-containing protein [Candidatus Thermoplasmatota archaeon]
MSILEIGSDLVEKDIEITRKALDKVIVAAPEKSHLRKVAEDFLLMSTSYFKDAIHFYEKGDLVNAYGCINYAHGWLDAGARLGLFETGGDNRLFTLLE